MNSQMQDPAAEFNRRMREILDTVEVPVDLLCKDLDLYIEKMLKVNSTETLKCDAECLTNLHTKPAILLDMHDLSKAINGVILSTPKDLELSSKDYVVMLNDLGKMAEMWNDIVVPLKQALEKKMRFEMEMQMKGNSNNIKNALKAPPKLKLN